MKRKPIKRAKIKRCPCPICPPNTVHVEMYIGSLAKCGRGHRFKVDWGTTTDRDLVLAVPVAGHAAMERFPVANDVVFA